MDEKRRTFISKKMSYALRHNPEKYGFVLAQDGSVSIGEFLKAMNAMHHLTPPLTETDIREIMANSEKQRFAIEDGRIRALYGHSIQQRIGHPTLLPPAILYHGTSHKALPSIMQEGLLPMGRQYVHLSADIETARQVGRRRDSTPVILQIDAISAVEDGVKFYLGNDKVWLADRVSPKYLKEM